MNLFAVTLFILASTLVVANSNERETEMVFGGVNQGEVEKKAKVNVLFLQSVQDQQYLESITERDRYILDLYNFDQHIKNVDFEQNPDVDYYCPKAMFDSLGLSGYFTPMPHGKEIPFCPAMTQTCCLPSDVEKLDLVWKQQYSEKVQHTQTYFRYYVLSLMKLQQQIKAVAEKVVVDFKKPICRKVAQKILDTTISDEVYQYTKKVMKRFFEFDYKMKRGFLCLLCDYANYRSFDFKNKFVGLNHQVCEKMVDETLDFYKHFNGLVYKYVNSVNFLAYCYDAENPDESGRISATQKVEFLEVDTDQSIDVCAHAKANGFNVFVNCLSYCSHYDVWYVKRPLYRDVKLLGRIFENVKTKLLDKDLRYDVRQPENFSAIKIMESKFTKFDLFNSWQFVFMDQSGVKFEHFVDMDYEDL